jgi:hypothetical protein
MKVAGTEIAVNYVLAEPELLWQFIWLAGGFFLGASRSSCFFVRFFGNNVLEANVKEPP